ncbi:MAG: hypothetical protein CUN52_09855 [Phototrophicales bacterium]|nr:MAG: hypothetical protein CUN52_09855 [Phototrophicales bacterium]
MRKSISVDNASNLVELTQVRCGWITQVLWSPDGSTLAIAHAEGVRLYVGQFGGNPKYTLTGHSGHVKGAAFSPNGRYLATVSADTTIKLWDTSDLNNGVTEIATLKGHKGSVEAVAFSPDNRTMATASADGTVMTWDAIDQKPLQTFIGHEREVTTVVFAMGGHILISGSWDNTLRLWDVRGETTGAVFGRHDDWVREVKANTPGTLIVSASKDMSVKLWDALDGGLYGSIDAHWLGSDTVAISPDSSLIATGGRDNVVRLWYLHQIFSDTSATKEQTVATLYGHEKPVLSLAFNPAGTLLASASGDNTVRLWQVDE